MISPVPVVTRASRRDVDEILKALLVSSGLATRGHPALPPPERWTALLPTLQSQRLSPLAFWVAGQCDVKLPSRVREELKSAFYTSSVRYDRLRSALAEIDDAFFRSGIPLIVLKGLSLAERVYPHPACRPMDDIDLLVRPGQLHAASRLLLSIGYSDKSFGIEDFRNPSSGIVVDLHPELLNTTRLPARRRAWDPDLDAWWKRARPLLSYKHVRSLHPQDHFVYLCHHAWLHHGLQKPIALIDVCLILRAIEASGSDQNLLRREDIGAIRRGLWYALLSCEEQFGLALPGMLRRNLLPPNARLFERIIQAMAIRGLLPEIARYAYLWFAIPTQGRMRFLRQFCSASLNVIGVRS